MDEKSNHERLKNLVQSGSVLEVKELLETGNCDVNKCDKDKYGDFDIVTLPLFVSLENIKVKK